MYSTAPVNCVSEKFNVFVRICCMFFLFTGPVLHYLLWSSTSVGDLPWLSQGYFNQYTCVRKGISSFQYSEHIALKLKSDQSLVSLNMVYLQSLPSSTYKIKRVGYLFAIRAICRIRLGFNFIDARAWHDQLSLSDHPSRPSKGWSGVLKVKWHLVVRSWTTPQPKTQPQGIMWGVTPL